MGRAMEDNDAPERVSVSFLWNQHGYAELARHMLDTEPVVGMVAARERRVNLVTGLIWGPLVVLLVHWLVERRSADLGAFGWILGLLVAVLLLMAATGRGGPWRKFQTCLRNGSAGAMGGSPQRLTIEVGADGVRVTDEDTSVHRKWSQFERIVRLPSHLAIMYAYEVAASGVLVPESAFTTKDDADRFERACERFLQQSGYGEADRVRAELSGNSVSCLCGHNLRGLREAKCPECGKAFTMITLHALRALREPWWRVVIGRRS